MTDGMTDLNVTLPCRSGQIKQVKQVRSGQVGSGQVGAKQK